MRHEGIRFLDELGNEFARIADQGQARAPNRPRTPIGRWAVRVAAGGVVALALALTPPGGAMAEWVGDLFRPGEPGSSPTNRISDAREPHRFSEAYIVAAGHAPDGARYELVLERGALFEEPPETPAGDGPVTDFSRLECLSFQWPEATTPDNWSASCGTERFPSRRVLESLAPGGAAARPFDFLKPPPHTREYMSVYGFARPDVARVRVLYRSAPGVLGEAPVELTELSTEVHERIGSRRPVDVFVAFLPWSAARIEPLEDPPLWGGEEYEGQGRPSRFWVVAYDARGHELSRIERTNLAHDPQDAQ